MENNMTNTNKTPKILFTCQHSFYMNCDADKQNRTYRKGIIR